MRFRGAFMTARDRVAAKSLMSASNRSREPHNLHARERRPTAVILPFPTAGVNKGRRGKIKVSGFVDQHLGRSSGSQSSQDIETTSLALIDYVALVFVLASVASGPLLVWFLLRTAH
jgi:hypothetical protein